MHFATLPAAFAAVTAADPARPLLTWYDDTTGERTELSGATLANWVAKTANLLVDEGGLGTGDAAVVDAPPHWQVAAVLLGCWSAGLQVRAPERAESAAVVFAAADRAERYVAPGRDVYGLALAPLAAPMRHRPPGVIDYVTAVRAHGDHFAPLSPVVGDDAATMGATGTAGAAGTVSHSELVSAARTRAEALGITTGARVLVDVASHPDPLDWLLAPLVVGGSTVLCRGTAPARLPERAATEHVTVTLT